MSPREHDDDRWTRFDQFEAQMREAAEYGDPEARATLQALALIRAANEDDALRAVNVLVDALTGPEAKDTIRALLILARYSEVIDAMLDIDFEPDDDQPEAN